MSWIVRYEPSEIEGLRAPIESTTCGMGERAALEKAIEETPKGFEVTGVDGRVLLRGIYAGDDGDMDWPLQYARLAAAPLDGIDPVALAYGNGKRFVFDSDLDMIRREA